MDFIRFSDKTTGNGDVISASASVSYDDRQVARKGDQVTCQKHPDIHPNLIMEGDETMTEDGVPLARHDHRVTCGCRLISSLR
jgi:uncharacterized Zn-binding protein involved in type VI secretion